MTKKTRMLWMHAMSPLHVGAGRGAGHVDLPLIREKVTDWPFVPGSAIKGALAEHYGATDKARRSNDALRRAFGVVGDDLSTAGAIVFTDAHLICLPVRSLYGTFAWCSAPAVLRRLRRDLGYTALEKSLPQPDKVRNDEVIVCEADSPLEPGDGKVYLEDLDLCLKQEGWANAWGTVLARYVFEDETWQDSFIKQFAIVSDDVFNFFAKCGTEVVPRIRIESGVAAEKALWYEEYLPAETILAGLIWCDHMDGEESLLDRFCREELTLHIGGMTTIGKGWTRIRFVTGGDPG